MRTQTIAFIVAAAAAGALALPAPESSPMFEFDFLTIDHEAEYAAREGLDMRLHARATTCSSSSNGPPSGLPSTYPSAKGARSCNGPVTVSAGSTFDGGLYRYDRGSGFRGSNNCEDIEPGDSDTIFLLNDGATLKNVIIGQEVKDAVYCYKSCTLSNVWFELTCEDSLTIKGDGAERTVKWTTGGVRGFYDKAVQHNAGGTVYLKDIDVWYPSSSKGKFYRSCGGCGDYQRDVSLESIRVHTNNDGEALVGVNKDNGDTATLKKISVPSAWGSSAYFCKVWPDKKAEVNTSTCKFKSSDITYT